MSHLGPEKVRQQFKGMVERCADCGFDLAGGQVEVVPTAHYMMGGVMFSADCRTELPGLFAAGEDTGGVHGANRLGGNGVANSTVFGGIAGNHMADWVREQGQWHAPDEAAMQSSLTAHLHPLGRPWQSLEPLREALFDCMWQDVGILRDAAGLQRALGVLSQLQEDLHACGVGEADRSFRLAWHDWMNLRNLISVSQVIATSALARENSRGAHYREDFPDTGSLTDSYYCVVRADAQGQLTLKRQTVQFTRVQPGHSLLEATA